MTALDYTVLTAFVYVVGNFIAPFLVLGADHYHSKKQFRMDIIIPFRLLVLGAMSFFKFLSDNFKETYHKLP